MAEIPAHPFSDQANSASLPLRSIEPVADQTETDGPPGDSSSETVMVSTVEAFKKRMLASNKKFINDRINEISEMELSQSDKLDMVARFWFGKMETEWPPAGSSSLSDHKEQRQREENATTIEDVRHFELLDTGFAFGNPEGIVAPTLVSKEARETFVDELEKLVNEAAGFGDDRRLAFPDEIKTFLKVANGVADIDLRDEGICGWLVVYSFKRESMDMQSLRDSVRAVYGGLTVANEIREEQMIWIEKYLRVKTGLLTGGPMEPTSGGCYWYSYYLFCRRWKQGETKRFDPEQENEDDYKKENGWAWRIVFESSSDSLANITSEPPIFDTIPEFLEWYSSWEKRQAEQILSKVQEVYEESGLLDDV